MGAAARDILVRDAVEADLPAIRDIYNHAVRETFAIWSDHETTTLARAAWMSARRQAGFPVLAAAWAERPDQLVGYASYGVFREFPGYAHTVEHSVYVAEGAQRCGVGRRLMETLIARARTAGLGVMVGGIDARNEASLELHRSLGFELQGVLKGVGRKFGQSLDLAFMVKSL